LGIGIGLRMGRRRIFVSLFSFSYSKYVQTYAYPEDNCAGTPYITFWLELTGECYLDPIGNYEYVEIDGDILNSYVCSDSSCQTCGVVTQQLNYCTYGVNSFLVDEIPNFTEGGFIVYYFGTKTCDSSAYKSYVNYPLGCTLNYNDVQQQYQSVTCENGTYTYQGGCTYSNCTCVYKESYDVTDCILSYSGDNHSQRYYCNGFPNIDSSSSRGERLSISIFLLLLSLIILN